MSPHVMGEGDWSEYYKHHRNITRKDFEILEQQNQLLANSISDIDTRMNTIEQQYSDIMQGIENVNKNIAELNTRLAGRN